LVRNPDTAKALLGEDIIFHQGDIRDLSTLQTAMPDMDAVISAVGSKAPVGKNCPKRVDYEGVANLVNTAKSCRVRRFILLSSIAVTRPNHPLNCFGKVLDWKLKGEETLRDSGLDYAIIRPGGLMDTPGGHQNLVFDQGDSILGMISREDVAEISVKALEYPHPLQVTFEVIEAEENSYPIDWSSLFGSFSKNKVVNLSEDEA
jgi:uncharacterized protein YbjT (DUF2867 family)